MKYYIIAGEASGDLHAARLIKAISRSDSNAEFRCWGGDKMQSEGAHVVKHYKDLAFMGFVEVLANISEILKNIKFCKADIMEWQPDAVILVDYPGFNMRIAKFAKSKNFKVYYYISPQVWAWKKYRVHKVNQYTDLAFVILPFETDFYAKYGYTAHYVGNPLVDSLVDINQETKEAFIKQYNLSQKPVIALIPGSRVQEITKVLPIMMQMVNKFPEYQFVISKMKNIDEKVYQDVVKTYDNVKLIESPISNILSVASAALVTSGTATLETALYNVPQVVCYKTSAASFFIAKKIVDVKFISLVNLIMDRQVVKELIQNDLNSENLYHHLNLILNDETTIGKMKDDYKVLKNKVGEKGVANRAADLILNNLLKH